MLPQSQSSPSLESIPRAEESEALKQGLTRRRGFYHIVFMSVSLFAIPFAIPSTVQTSIISGGPVTMLWGFVFVSAINVPLALSLAEFCSKFPSSAGIYYWTYQLAPPKHRLLISWIVGWLITVGYWVMALSTTFGEAQLIIAGVNIFIPDWEVKPWHTYLIFAAVMAFTTGVSMTFDHILPGIDTLSAFCNLIGIVVMVICLSAKAASGRHSIEYALAHFDASQSGWNPGWSFFIGLLPGLYSFLSIPVLTVMGDDVYDPSINLPKAIVAAVPCGCLLGVMLLLALVFTLPDVSALLASPNGQPEGLILQLVMGSPAGGFGMWLIVFCVLVMCTFSASCATSRVTWSFARDKAIPFHRLFSSFGPRRLSDTPVYAYLLSASIQLGLGCIYLGSTTAFNSFVAVAIICFAAGCGTVFVLSLAEGRKSVSSAPFSLGPWGYPINILALLWTLFEIVIVSMPETLPVHVNDMNFASAVFVGFAVVSMIWYIIKGRRTYHGPVIATHGGPM